MRIYITTYTSIRTKNILFLCFFFLFSFSYYFLSPAPTCARNITLLCTPGRFDHKRKHQDDEGFVQAKILFKPTLNFRVHNSKKFKSFTLFPSAAAIIVSVAVCSSIIIIFI